MSPGVRGKVRAIRQLEEDLGERLQDDERLARRLGRAVDVADLAGRGPDGGRLRARRASTSCTW